MTQERLKELVSYDPDTGVFTWLPRFRLRHLAKDGRAGCVNKRTGYRYLSVEGVHYKASRLAWLYVYGQWPTHAVDHINRDRADDRLVNLREATIAENNQNRGEHKNNTSGWRGVFKDKNNPTKWRAQITVNGKRRHLGCFDTPEEASQAYLAARMDAFTFQPVPRER